MIRSFRHRGLKNLYEKDSLKGVRADQAGRIKRILARLDEEDTAAGMDIPGFRLHLLRGDMKGLWAVSVSGNWCIVFRMEGVDAFDVDLVDYH